MTPPLNIVLFGGTGAGKSSIVNMMADQANLADISSGASGCTMTSKPYLLQHRGISYRVHDTAGLDEGDAGRVPPTEAIAQLYWLLEKLSDGVSLLIFCMRGPRILDNAHKNWRLFNEVICKRQVPICIAITGLEQEDNMDDWWINNKRAFHQYEMMPSGVACITGTRGKLNKDGKSRKFDAEYEESKDKMWSMIDQTALATPWKTAPVEWFTEIVVETYGPSNIGNCWDPEVYTHKEQVLGSAFQAMQERCGFSREQVDKLAARLR